MKFKIIKGEGLKATIEKSEHEPTQFEVINVKNHCEAVKKTIKELGAKIKLEEAMISNIERNHKELQNLDETLIQACYLLTKSKLAILPAQEKLDELNGSMKEYQKEIDLLEEQTGIKIWETQK